jgi:hypothetical protein
MVFDNNWKTYSTDGVYTLRRVWEVPVAHSVTTILNSVMLEKVSLEPVDNSSTTMLLSWFGKVAELAGLGVEVVMVVKLPLAM